MAKHATRHDDNSFPAQKRHRAGGGGAPTAPARPVKYGRTRSAVVCPYCGAKYERFRSPSVPDFAAASAVMLAAAQAMVAEHNDYSKPAKRPAILGYMHGCKLTAWKDEHVSWCQYEQEHRLANTAPTGDPPFFED